MKKFLGFAILSFAAVFTFARANGGGGGGGGGSSGPVYQTPSATIVSISQIPQQTIKVGGTFDEGYHFRMVVNVNNTTDISMGLADWTGIGDRSMASSGNTLFVISEAGVGSSEQIEGYIQGEEFTDTVRVAGQKQLVIDIFYKIPVGSAGGEYKSIYKLKLASDPSYVSGTVSAYSKGQNRSYYYTPDTFYEVGRVQVNPQDSAIEINGLTFINEGDFDLRSYLSKVEVIKDGNALTNQSWSVNSNGELKISFAKDTIDANAKVLYVINIEIDDLDNFGTTIQLKLQNINAVETVSNTRADIDEPLILRQYKFNGDKITLSKGTLDKTVYAKAGDTDVVVAEGMVTLGESVKFSKIELNLSDTDKDSIDAIRIRVAGDEYEGNKNTADKIIFTNVIFEKNGKVQLLVDIKEGVKNVSIKFPTIGVNALMDEERPAYYDNYSNQIIESTAIVGSIDGATLKVEELKTTLKNDISKAVEVKAGETLDSRIVLFDGEFTAKRADVFLNEAKIIANDDLAEDDYVSFYLTVGEREVHFYMDHESNPILEYFNDIEVKKDNKVKVKIEAEPKLSKGNYDFSLALQGQDEDGDETGRTENIAMVRLEAKEFGPTVIEDGVVYPRNTVVKQEDDLVLAEFIIKPTQGMISSDLEEIELTITSTAVNFDINNIVVEVDNDKIDDDINVDESDIIITNLSEPLKDGVHVKVYYKGEAPTGDYKVTLNSVNDEQKNRAYKRKVVDALVSIVAQDHGIVFTSFTFEVDREDSNVVISDLEVFTTQNDEYVSLRKVNTPAWNGEKYIVNDLVNDDFAKIVTKLTYYVDGEQVVIERSIYEDFFRIGKNSIYVNSN